MLGEKAYRLTGNVLARQGHYTAIACLPENTEKKQWYNFNDWKVRPVDPPKDRQCTRAIFLYFGRSGKPS